MPVANMLAARGRGRGVPRWNGAHKISQRHRGPAGPRLPPPVHRRPGPGPHRVDHCASTDWPTPRSISDGTAPRLWFSTGSLGQSAAAPGPRDFQQVMTKVCRARRAWCCAGGVTVVAESADFQRMLEFCQVTVHAHRGWRRVYDLRGLHDQLSSDSRGPCRRWSCTSGPAACRRQRRAAAEGICASRWPIGYVYDIECQVAMDLTRRFKRRWRTSFVRSRHRDVLRVVKAFRTAVFDHGQSWTGKWSGCDWRQSQARAILRNPTYAGGLRLGLYSPNAPFDADGKHLTRSVRTTAGPLGSSHPRPSSRLHQLGQVHATSASGGQPVPARRPAASRGPCACCKAW